MEHNSNASLRKSRSCLDGATWTAFAQSEGLDKISGGIVRADVRLPFIAMRLRQVPLRMTVLRDDWGEDGGAIRWTGEGPGAKEAAEIRRTRLDEPKARG